MLYSTRLQLTKNNFRLKSQIVKLTWELWKEVSCELQTGELACGGVGKKKQNYIFVPTGHMRLFWNFF